MNSSQIISVVSVDEMIGLSHHPSALLVTFIATHCTSMPITLRAAVADDEAFLYELYASTRAEEMALFGWDAQQCEIFLRMQFNAQRQSYAEFPNPDHRIILRDGQPIGPKPIGRMLVLRLEKEFCLADIALLPNERGAGLGARLIGDLLAEAAQAGKPVRLHVADGNRARRLYERLGFTPAGDDGVYCAMKWRANSGDAEN
ncbi:GNAT family N-acetyltransferase [Tabrizicola sp.]|uniref:GNAT family N-acetyltransferase n=1 Tax=Tabrizicola sp. TaxID=2005166 RepID=UPI00286A15FC|nr:GNAT family N-acetyltransferase [Tabrizicola sp.]